MGAHRAVGLAGPPAIDEPPDGDWALRIVHVLASEYGWSRADILYRIPWPDIRQLMQIINDAHTPKDQRATAQPSALHALHQKIVTRSRGHR